MLEVNDFDAVRISLASPEQIRSWSHGAVTKPETINYRTLKPERDGLFCERIFGPTKDWECYCGKYKRVRYKGVVCDKCGVEVARAKVRRERMGHIELASPVSHVWYVKGTPSRLGLLLDISPRNLERVLYFATYIVTNVDQEARQRFIKHVKHEYEQKAEDLQRRLQQETDKVNSARDEEIARARTEYDAQVKRLDEERAAAADNIINEARVLEEKLRGMRGQTAESEIDFGPSGVVIVPKGEEVTADYLARLKDHVEAHLDEVEKRIEEQKTDHRSMFEAQEELQVRVAQDKLNDIVNELSGGIDEVHKEEEEKLDELESIEEKQLLSETRYRELHDEYGKFFTAAMGAEAIYDIVGRVDLNEIAAELRGDIQSLSGQRRKKAAKRLRVVEALRKSGNRPEWMIFTALPVIPPDLRPMVQLDGGRFATSDLNDLYRRVINRNNRLKRLLELQAPEIIIRNEKRMLQEAVDALIDNGRRGRVVAGSGKHKLKSLSDMLKGKQGRFRQNLLGKRVDYSGRSVIVVGPELKLHQCGLPKKMALELFKPFVMRRLVERGYAHNIKSAKRIVERIRPEVWDVLEEVIRDYLVLLNRAPTLHRLGIQAFEAVLIEGSAIQIHPLVTTAYNADFDGDQMAVHVPLSAAAQKEARERMLSTRNLLSPSNGEPVVTPTQDVVLGCYYMTLEVPEAQGTGKVFASEDEAILAYQMGAADLRARITVPIEIGGAPARPAETTIGRIIFNQVLPAEIKYVHNDVVDKKALKRIIARCYRNLGAEKTAVVADAIKRIGFRYATRGGLTISVSDIEVPKRKQEILDEADARVDEIERQYRRGLITDEERRNETVNVWTEATETITDAVKDELNPRGAIYMMATSGARGNIQQIRQMAGMRGLMADPSGRIIELPIRSNFREGLSVLEYFISTHGARKGLADTALRTADSGYLTRRLVDVAQDIIVTIDDCETEDGIWLVDTGTEDMPEPLADRILGRMAAEPVVDENTGEVVVDRNEEIDEEKVAEILSRGIDKVRARSPLTCEAEHGVCRMCYGRNLATGHLVDIGEAVGIIAAQSIGEPGTQLTMRTFHTGGVAGEDITSGLPRVEELFEARVPKGLAILSEIEGVVEIEREEDVRKIRIISAETFTEDYPVPSHYEVMVKDGEEVRQDDILAQSTIEGEEPILTTLSGRVGIEGNTITVVDEQREEREYTVPHTSHLKVDQGQRVYAGQQLTEGSINPQDILQIQGREAVQRYLVDEVQRVYRSQGVNTNDKHIEVIVRKMLRKVSIDNPGDTEFLPGELVDRYTYEEANNKVLAEGGEPATAQTVLLGVTKASLNTESFLSAASFQETTRVLTEAAINGSIDYLRGLKENVIIGKLIPAGSGIERKKKPGEEFPEGNGHGEIPMTVEGPQPELSGTVALMEAEPGLLPSIDEAACPPDSSLEECALAEPNEPGNSATVPELTSDAAEMADLGSSPEGDGPMQDSEKPKLEAQAELNPEAEIGGGEADDRGDAQTEQ